MAKLNRIRTNRAPKKVAPVAALRWGRDMAKRNPGSPTKRIARPKTSAPKTTRRRALAEDAASEIGAAPPPPAATEALPTAAAETAAPMLSEAAPVAPEIVSSAPAPAAAPEPAPAPMLVFEPRVRAGEDEPTTRVVFRGTPPITALRPRTWILVRSIFGRLHSELAPVRARLRVRFPRLAGIGDRILARWA
jgi:hypothetical protein